MILPLSTGPVGAKGGARPSRGLHTGPSQRALGTSGAWGPGKEK